VLGALAARGAAVLVAPPGAGKSTLVPLALAGEEGRAGRVLVLEPRRLAARALARRLAALQGEPLGRSIGLRMRGETAVSAATVVEVVTQGVLTRMIQDDPALDGVATVVFDEFHERPLDADLGLALCLESRAALRDDLRVLVMSATLDTAAVARLLGDAPVLRSAGRAFPVEVVWAPPDPRQRADDAVAALVRRAIAEQPEGDVLVFLPGRAEIARVGDLLATVAGVEVVALHAGTDTSTQDRLFTPVAQRRVVLATSLAETSVTLPGVRTVVDGGRSRRPFLDVRRGMGGLETVPVGQDAAEQRRGRAGRLGPGVCYRLWSAAAHERLAARAQPEIASADLTPLALELAVWGAEPAALAFLDQPPAGAYAAARAVLAGLGALDEAGRVTAHGRQLARAGAHPRLAQLVAVANRRGWPDLGAAVAAVVEHGRAGPGDLRDRLRQVPAEVRVQADRLAGRPVDWRAVGRDVDAAGALVAAAFPERVGQLRGGGRYALAGGSGAALEPGDPLAQAPLLAVAELLLQPGRPDARITLAAPIEEADLPGPVEVGDEVSWDRQAGDVRARRVRRFGGLVLAESPLAGPQPAALLDGLRAEGLRLLPWTAEHQRWRERVAFCHRVLGPPWPDVSDEALLAGLDRWLAPSLSVAARRADLARVDLGRALAGLLDWPLPQRLDEVAPSQIAVPSGHRHRLDYGGDHPVLAVKLQECFGWKETPRVADGGVAVVLHLLSPAGRPAAVTADLAGFWAGAYHQVRAELRGRYPKHPWPEDPTTATPTARTKPRP
jgi:ATP-dependent helicase HrpB